MSLIASAQLNIDGMAGLSMAMVRARQAMHRRAEQGYGQSKSWLCIAGLSRAMAMLSRVEQGLGRAGPWLSRGWYGLGHSHGLGHGLGRTWL